MDRGELRSELQFRLNNNDTGVDADFSTTRLNSMLQHAYRREVARAKQECSRIFFKTTRDIVWPAAQLTFDLRDYGIGHLGLIRIADVTSADPGVRLCIDEFGRGSDVFWKNHHTLQWGTAGPSSDKTLRFEFYGEGELLTDDADVPELIPEELHDIIPLAAAVYAYEVAENEAPQAWLVELNELRMDYWKRYSSGRPSCMPPTIQQSESQLDYDLR